MASVRQSGSSNRQSIEQEMVCSFAQAGVVPSSQRNQDVDFDAAVIVLFDDEFQVWRAARLPVELLEEVARFVGHVKGYRVMATDSLLDRGEDWTDRMRQAAQP